MISIIMPVYHEGNEFIARLNILLATQPIEQLIIVDGSNYARVELLKTKMGIRVKTPRFQYLSTYEAGRAKQMNHGASKSTGEYLLFLHADTTLPRGALEHIKLGLDAGWHWGRFDVELITRRKNKHWIYEKIAKMINWRSATTGIATGDQAIFMTRAAYDLVGGFENIALMEDIAMSKRLGNIGPPLCLKTKVKTSARRWEQNGVIRTIILMWLLRFAFFMGVPPSLIAKLYRSTSNS